MKLVVDYSRSLCEKLRSALLDGLVFFQDLLVCSEICKSINPTLSDLERKEGTTLIFFHNKITMMEVAD